MKKIILGIFAIAVMFLAVSCGSQSSPKAVATKYVKALQKGDTEAAADCFYYSGTDEEISEQRSSVIALVQKGLEGLKKKDGIKSFEVTSVDENEDKAVVHGIITYGDDSVSEDETIATVKMDGKWYIDTNK